MLEELEAFGAPADVIEACRARAERTAGEHYDVLKENWPAWLVFQGMVTQWDRAGMAGTKVGLNYGRIEPVLKALPAAQWQDYPVLFAKLQILELTYLKILREKD